MTVMILDDDDDLDGEDVEDTDDDVHFRVRKLRQSGFVGMESAASRGLLLAMAGRNVGVPVSAPSGIRRC